jgi:hypothetical protein
MCGLGVHDLPNAAFFAAGFRIPNMTAFFALEGDISPGYEYLS